MAFACLACMSTPAGGQMSQSAPITVYQNAPGAQQIWLHAEVLHADRQTMMVREQDNPRNIHTFTYSPKVQQKMEKVLENGGYQHGDKVKILYQVGQTVALEIHGKPSKPL